MKSPTRFPKNSDFRLPTSDFARNDLAYQHGGNPRSVAGIRATITPELRAGRSRRAGRAIIPGQHKSPGIRADDHRPQFLVKINANIGNKRRRLIDRRGSREDALGRTKWGADTVMDFPPAKNIHRHARMDHSQLAGGRLGTVPRFIRHFEKVGRAEELKLGNLPRHALLNRPEQGVDLFYGPTPVCF